MAERRMFAKTIIDSDAFLDMPISARLLYYDLGMRADDDGFINNPKKIQRIIGASDDDLKLLIAKKFIIPFESGVVVIKHWRLHNYIQADRYKPTVYTAEKKLLTVKPNKSYTLTAPTSEPLEIEQCIQNVYNLDTQVRLGKDRLGKVSKEKGPSVLPLIEESGLSDSMKSKLAEWVDYKKEKKDTYVPSGFSKLITTVKQNIGKHGEPAVIELIDLCMSNNWKGIIWEKLKDKPKGDDFTIWQD